MLAEKRLPAGAPSRPSTMEANASPASRGKLGDRNESVGLTEATSNAIFPPEAVSQGATAGDCGAPTSARGGMAMTRVAAAATITRLFLDVTLNYDAHSDLLSDADRLCPDFPISPTAPSRRLDWPGQGSGPAFRARGRFAPP